MGLVDELEIAFYTSVDLNETCKRLLERIGENASSFSLKMNNKGEWIATIYIHVPYENRNMIRGWGDNPQAAINNLILDIEVEECNIRAWWDVNTSSMDEVRKLKEYHDKS